MDDPAGHLAASARVDAEDLRRSAVAVVTSALLALVLVVASAAIVAVVVLPIPAAPDDPAASREPVGLVRAAPRDPPAGRASARGSLVLELTGDAPARAVAPMIAATATSQDGRAAESAPTPTPQVMVLPTVAVRTPPPREADTGAEHSERWGQLLRGPFRSFGSDISPRTPDGAGAAQAVPLAAPMLSSPPPDTLATGTRVVVTVPSARLRGAPSLDGPVLAGLAQGQALVVTGPPVPGSDYLWYPVVADEPGLAGYVAAALIAPPAS